MSALRPICDIFRSYAVFDAEGRHVNGTDKQSNHRYGDAYEQLFTYNRIEEDLSLSIKSYYPHSCRGDVKLMMEVGIADGSSLLAWREVFPHALCVGMDIHPSHKAHGERLEFHLGDQTSREDCERAAGGREFDVIIEDATHRVQDSLLTLLYLYRYLKPNGVYIIEEFDNVGALRENIESLWPSARIIDTQGPFGGVEPLVVLQKPYYGPSVLRKEYTKFRSKHGT